MISKRVRTTAVLARVTHEEEQLLAAQNFDSMSLGEYVGHHNDEGSLLGSQYEIVDIAEGGPSPLDPFRSDDFSEMMLLGHNTESMKPLPSQQKKQLQLLNQNSSNNSSSITPL